MVSGVAGATPDDDEVASSNPGSATSSGNSGNNQNSSASVGDTVLATAGYDHTVKLWHLHTALCIKTFQHPDSQINDLGITPDRKMVAAAGFQHIRMFDVNSLNVNPTLNFEGLVKNITSIGFNKDGQWMYSGGEDFNARIWDLRSSSPQCQKVFQTHSSPITCTRLHPNNVELIISDQNGTIHVWDLRNDRTEQLIPDQSSSIPIQHIAIDPLGNHLAAVNNKGDCYIWKLEAGSEKEPMKLCPHHRMKAHSRFALKCYFSPDSNYLATTSADQTCKVWKVSDFSMMTDLHCSGQRWVWDCAFTGDSQFIITASSDNLARLWSLESGQTKREYNGHQKPITCVAFRDPSTSY